MSNEPEILGYGVLNKTDPDWMIRFDTLEDAERYAKGAQVHTLVSGKDLPLVSPPASEKGAEAVTPPACQHFYDDGESVCEKCGEPKTAATFWCGCSVSDGSPMYCPDHDGEMSKELAASMTPREIDAWQARHCGAAAAPVQAPVMWVQYDDFAELVAQDKPHGMTYVHASPSQIHSDDVPLYSHPSPSDQAAEAREGLLREALRGFDTIANSDMADKALERVQSKAYALACADRIRAALSRSKEPGNG